jgi:hypothetical protein
LFAALKVAQPETTIEKAGQLFRLDTIGVITIAIAEAYKLSMPEQKKSNEPEDESKQQ